METQAISVEILDGPEQAVIAAARVQQGLRRTYRRLGELRHRRMMLTSVDRVLILCLLVCLVALGVGLDRLYPLTRPQAVHAFKADLPARPFTSCEAAFEAGVHSIPIGHPAYTAGQDQDGDGLACEPS